MLLDLINLILFDYFNILNRFNSDAFPLSRIFSLKTRLIFKLFSAGGGLVLWCKWNKNVGALELHIVVCSSLSCRPQIYNQRRVAEGIKTCEGVPPCGNVRTPWGCS